MNGKSENSLLDRVINMLSPDFGIADSSGRIVFPSDGGIIHLPDVEKQEEIFVEADDFCFWSDNSDALWFFDKSPQNENEKENLKNLLSLASEVFNTSIVAKRERKNDFFRDFLMFSKNADKNSPLYLEYFGANDKKSEYSVLLVKDTKELSKTSSIEENLSTCYQIIGSLFTEEDGCLIVKMAQGTIAVILPISQDYPYEQWLETAAVLKDTIQAEVLIDINVSMGAVMKAESLDEAYKTAYSTLNIGLEFELPDKCFSYKKLGLSRLFHSLDKDICREYILETFGKTFVTEHEKESTSGEVDELDKTICTYLDYNQNVSEAAKALIIHRNTLNYRIEKFNKMTGLDCSKFEDGVKIKIGFLIMKAQKFSK